MSKKVFFSGYTVVAPDGAVAYVVRDSKMVFLGANGLPIQGAKITYSGCDSCMSLMTPEEAEKFAEKIHPKEPLFLKEDNPFSKGLPVKWSDVCNKKKTHAEYAQQFIDACRAVFPNRSWEDPSMHYLKQLG